jgi:hypothetical protein
MKSSIFWDITPSGPLKVSACFGRTCRLHFQGRKQPWRWMRHDLPNCGLTLNGLHGVISQKIELLRKGQYACIRLCDVTSQKVCICQSGSTSNWSFSTDGFQWNGSLPASLLFVWIFFQMKPPEICSMPSVLAHTWSVTAKSKFPCSCLWFPVEFWSL